MKKFIMALVCLMTMVIGLSSCSKDDDVLNNDYKSLIVGTWEVTHVDGIVDLSNDIPQLQDVHINKSFTDTETSNDWIDEQINDFHVRMQFSNINNSVSVFYYHNHKWDYKDYGRLLYYIQGNRLVMYDTEEWVGDEDYIENSYEIVSLTKNYMKLHLSGEDSKRAREHGKSHQYITYELKRIGI